MAFQQCFIFSISSLCLPQNESLSLRFMWSVHLTILIFHLFNAISFFHWPCFSAVQHTSSSACWFKPTGKNNLCMWNFHVYSSQTDRLIDVLFTDHRHSSSKSKRRVWDGKLRPCAMDMEWTVFIHLRAYLGVYYFLSLTVCLSVTNFKLILFCFSMESSHFLAVSSPWPPLQDVVLWFLI